AESYLEEQGHDVLSAGTAAGALALLDKTAQVDVLFTNVDLKGEIAAGIELAHEAARRKPNLKVLYTTERSLTDGMKARFVKNSAFLPNGDAVRAFPHQPAAAAPAGERLVYSARSDCRHAE